ncbi:UvrD-helicase domain-containing protein [Conexibacter woesei]|uniref:UvrD-helicase domain-containing protein n=1 Tax=Conexibacter woesei TaxID=191495 RepID=UPI00040FC7A8|nr:UvrD-helicase domain-containing protein [Conexibacter woesei]
MSDFDICGPLPTGVTVLEASAGTGKTYTIAALATRYVADGLRLDELLLVTFTRAATGELRDRVRQRLTATRAALDRVLTGETPAQAAAGDRLVALLAQGDADAVRRRRDRLAIALADFDAATIATTHGFCQEVLLGLGVAGDIDPGHRFSEDARDLVEDVVTDLYINRFNDNSPPHGLDREQARMVVGAAIGNPTAPLAPLVHDANDDAPALRHGLAETARAELDRRKRALALMTFDDLVTRLRAALDGPSGTAVAQAMRARWRVALVDEFQDTDPDQWAIVRAAFAHPDSTLVLIGDPKQAVYAFRGADVYAYLDARAVADARPTLGTNYRSDRGLLEGFDALFGDANLGHAEIMYRRTEASPEHQRSRLEGAPAGEALRFRVVARHDPDVARTKTDWSKAPAARAFVARDCAADIARLLASGARAGGAPLHAGDVAVLVRTNAQARTIKAALDAAGVPAVLNTATSVFATDAARDWLALLEALERPEYLPRAKAAALTKFLNWTAAEVAGAGDGDWDDVQARLHEWAGLLRRTGVATLMEDITQRERLPERLLGVTGGERVLTDLRHVAELLHGAAIDGRLGITALASWLRHRMSADDREAGSEERARRLESDAAAVQVLTVHRSKGLEFGVVHCPFLWDPFRGRDRGEAPAIYHDAARGNERTLDVSLETRDAAFVEHADAAAAEQAGEELRLAYVALTRAKHQAVVWWATSWTCRDSPLGRLMFERDFGPDVGEAPPARTDANTVATSAAARFRALAALAPDAIALERALVEKVPPREAVAGEAVVPDDLGVAVFDRTLDARWRRVSYSAITAGAYEARVASEVEEAVGADDAPDERVLVADAGAGAGAGPDVPLAAMPAGTRIGTLVHAVLEATDFAAPDLGAELGDQVAVARRRWTTDVGDPIMLVDGLARAIETPLGPEAGDLRLRDLQRGDRLDELTFELPLVGGDTPSGALTLRAIATVLREHVAEGDPLHGYADRLSDPMLKANLRGYLTGTIDLVARHSGGYAIIDYKTNRLSPPGTPLTAWHHRPEALAEEMARSHYALQALLYAVALHRYLRWRVPSYDAERDRPTVMYLFLRGMTGAGAPGSGVFSWRPPAGLLPALSDTLDRGDADGGAVAA